MPGIHKVMDNKELLRLQQEADRVYVDPAIMEFAVQLVAATRHPEKFEIGEVKPYIMFGASPRASINLILAGRALAFVRGRNYALPQDVLDITYDVLRHRIVLSYEALSDNVTSDDLLKIILSHILIPVVPLHERTSVHINS
jgi:MoxR-like ATPase